mmetsp:Transcript_98420/g.317486  ORF Transcript_98420/g.317486 Transcript_98420/m.317486 type:complete len:365 (-) Transcript_98420:141-1235(-)
MAPTGPWTGGWHGRTAGRRAPIGKKWKEGGLLAATWQRPLIASAAGAAAVAASFAATMELGGFGLSAGAATGAASGLGVSFGTGGLLAAIGLAPSAVLAGGLLLGIAALSVASGVELPRFRTLAGGPSSDKKREEDGALPLLASSSAAVSRAAEQLSRRSFTAKASGMPQQVVGERLCEQLDESGALDEEAPPRVRDRFRGKRRRLMNIAAGHVRSWSAALALRGIEVIVDGQLRNLRLEPPSWRALLLSAPLLAESATEAQAEVGEEEEAGDDEEAEAEGSEQLGEGAAEERLPLLGIALRLELPSSLVLVVGSGRDARLIRLSFPDRDVAVELALALKVPTRIKSSCWCDLRDLGAAGALAT